MSDTTTTVNKTIKELAEHITDEYENPYRVRVDKDGYLEITDDYGSYVTGTYIYVGEVDRG